MFRFFPLVIILQGYCLYHIYNNKVDQKWYWLVVFLPVIGCTLYLYQHFYNRQNIDHISEGLKGVVNTNYQVEKMEKKVLYSATISNKMALADKYMEMDRHDEAVELYESCLEGFNKDDPYTMIRLIKAYYFVKNYKKAIHYGELLATNKEFSNSEEKIAYAWSLYEDGQLDLAREKFIEMDIRFSNYLQRVEYSKFLLKMDEKLAAIKLLEELIDEHNQMESYEKRLNRGVNRTIRGLYNKTKE